MDRKEIEAARKAGILDDAKAAELEAFVLAERGPGASSDDENLRFLTNFNDIFISVGLVLLSIGLIVGSGLVLGPTGSAVIILTPVLAVLWILLEYFAGRRRLTLPSMTASLMFTGLSMLLMALVASGFADTDSLANNFFGGVSGGLETISSFGLWAGIGGVAAGAAVYARFRLPFALFLIALGVAFAFYITSAANGNVGAVVGGGASLLIGVVTLVVAVIFDGRDPARMSLSSDNAFWLHMAAAPQIMLGLRALFSGGVFDQSLATGEAVALLLALVGFSILSLALNRRALIAAGLISFWVAIKVLAAEGSGGLASIALPLLLLGGAIVLLGAGWKTARRLVLTFMPSKGIFARIFPPEPA